jgi:GTP cyclohydrolase II
MRFKGLQIEGPIKLPLLLSSGKVEEFELYHFKSSKEKYQILVKGDVRGKKMLMRIESACTYAHLYGSQLCDCQWQLREALKRIAENGRGILIYALDQHGRGIGFDKHIKVYMEEQRKGLDTVEAHKSLGLEDDFRDYSDIVDILKYFEVSDVELLTNNPNRIRFLKSMGFKIKRVQLEAEINKYNIRELSAKKKKLGHLLSKIK